MSWRPRGGAARRTRPGNHPVYEDFKPTTEGKHEEGADIVLFHLPGFSKEQIRIIAESKGVLRVQGERLVTSNRWSRFQEKVVVPEDCNMTEVRAKFEAGILRIIMPKKTVTVIDRRRPVEEQLRPMTRPTHLEPRPPPRPSVTKPADVQPKPPQHESQVGSSLTKPSDVQPKPLPQHVSQERSSLPKPTDVQPKPPQHMSQDGSSLPKPTDVQPKPPQRVSHQDLPPKPTLPPIAQTPQFGTSMNLPKPPETQKEASTPRAPMKPSFDFKPPQNSHDHIQQQHIPNYVKPKVVEDRKLHEDSTPVMDSKGSEGKEKQPKHEKYVDAIDHHKESNNGVNRINRFDNHMNEMIGRLSKRLDENGHLLVNMGAAILVIVALGTYISYSFGLRN